FHSLTMRGELPRAGVERASWGRPSRRPDERRSMSQRLRRTLVGLAVGSTLLAGCSIPVHGTASPGPGEPVDVTAAQLHITAAVQGPVDQWVRNALTDLTDFWSRAYPQYFGEPFTPLSGGYFSVDSD